MMTDKPYTNREVHFEVSRTVSAHAFDLLMDECVEVFWEQPVLGLWQPGIGSHGRVLDISGVPWWMPLWWVRRKVTNIAYSLGVGGFATSHIERVSPIYTWAEKESAA
jgi:hypothetical protein